MPKYLRPEAFPADWTSLDEKQQTAFKAVVRVIGEAIEPIKDARKSPTGAEFADDPNSWMSGNRSSRMAFLSGGRGTGKTTLLLSIIKATLRESRDTLDLNDIENQYLTLMRDHVVWLEPLDMEPMPPTANLLAAILVRIEDAVKRLGVAAGLPGSSEEKQEYEPRSLLYAGPRYHEALLDLQRLQTDSALAWFGNLPAREGQLDPDSYAVEVMRNERARLSLNRRLEEALDALAKQAFRGMGIRSPLFVLPVDDLDLNPAACLELLKLLRMISVTRLFTLLLGDLRVADLVLNLKLSSDLGQLLHGVRHAELLALPPFTVGALASDIAANALRKLLPPSQRIELAPMSLLEGLSFLPLGHDKNDPSLHALLARCPVLLLPEIKSLTAVSKQQPANASLRDFLLVDGFSIEGKRLPEKPRNAPLELTDLRRWNYTGMQLFQSTPRRLADFWLELQRITDTLPAQSVQTGSDQQQAPSDKVERAWQRVVNYFASLCIGSLSSDPTFLPQERTMLTTSIVQNPKIKSGWEIGRLPLLIYDRVENRPALEFRDPDPDNRYTPHVCLGESKGWRIQVGAVSQSERSSGSEAAKTASSLITTVPALSDAPGQRLLARSTAAELVVFHDLCALAPDAQSFSSPLVPEMPMVGSGWVTVQWYDGHNSALLPWLAPRFQSFWEFDRFLGAWNQIIGQTITDVPILLQRAFFAWISAATAVVDGQDMVSLPPNYQLINDTQWQPLTKRLENLIYKAANSELARDWLVRVALMLMPETDLPNSPATPIAGSVVLRGFWQQQSQPITRSRALRLGELVRNLLADVVDILQNARPPFVPGDLLDPPIELIYQMVGMEPPTRHDRVKARKERPAV